MPISEYLYFLLRPLYSTQSPELETQCSFHVFERCPGLAMLGEVTTHGPPCRSLHVPEVLSILTSLGERRLQSQLKVESLGA